MEPTDLNSLDIGRLTDLYQNSSKTFSHNEKEQLLDRKYCTNSHYQLSSQDRAELRKRRMPNLTLNYCEKLERSLTGIIESNPIEPVAIPNNIQSQDSADLVTKLIRHYLARNNWSKNRLDVSDDFFVEGVGIAIIDMEDEPVIRRVSPYDFFYDASSKENDFSDATYIGIRKWITEGQLKTLYPERYEELGSPLDDNTFANTVNFMDSTAIELIDRKNKKLALIEMYELNNGKWNRYVFAANGVYDYDESLYNTPDGKSFHPICAVSNIVDVEHNYRLGSIRRVRSAQDVINQAMIKVAADINSRQIQQTDISAVGNAEEARREVARPDGAIPYGWTPVSNAETVQGNIQLIQSNVDFIMDSIPSGDQTGPLSGRAKMIDQQYGLTEYAKILKLFSSLEEMLYRKIWNISQYYITAEQTINISGDPKAPEFMTINKCVGFQPQVIDGPEGPVQQMMPIFQNSLPEINVNIVFQQTSADGALQQEVFQNFTSLIQSGVQINSPEFEVLFELAPLEDKEEARQVIEKYYGPSADFQQQQQAQMQAQQSQAQIQQIQQQIELKTAQLNLAKLEAEIEQIRSTTQKNLSSVNETQQNLQIQAATEAVQVKKDLAEANLKEAKSEALMSDLQIQQRNHTMDLINQNRLMED